MVGLVKGDGCSFLHSGNCCKCRLITKVLGSRFIHVSTFRGYKGKSQCCWWRSFHWAQTIALMACSQQSLLQRAIRELGMEDLQHLPPDGMVALQDSKSVMCSSGYQFHLHAMGWTPVSEGLSLVWSRSVHTKNCWKSKASHPSALHQSYLHLGRLLCDVHVNLIARKLIKHGEDRLLLVVPLDVERVNGQGVVEVRWLPQSCHSHCLRLLLGQTGCTLVSSGHLDIGLRELPLPYSCNQTSSRWVSQLLVQHSDWTQSLLPTNLDQLLVLLKVLHLLGWLLNHLHHHQFCLSSPLSLFLHGIVDSSTKTMDQGRLIVLHCFQHCSSSKHLGVSLFST